MPEPSKDVPIPAPEVVKKTLKETGLSQAQTRFRQLQQAITDNQPKVAELTTAVDSNHPMMLTRTLKDLGTMLEVVEDAFRGGIAVNTEVERSYQPGGLDQKVIVVVSPHGNIRLEHFDTQKFGADKPAERASGIVTITPEGTLQVTRFCIVRNATTPEGRITSTRSYDLDIAQARKEGVFEYWDANVDLTTHTTDFQPLALGDTSLSTHIEQSPKTSSLKVAQNQSGTKIASRAASEPVSL